MANRVLVRLYERLIDSAFNHKHRPKREDSRCSAFPWLGAHRGPDVIQAFLDTSVALQSGQHVRCG